MQNKSNYVLLLKGRRNLLLCYGLYTIILISCYGRRGSVANHTLEYLHVFVINISHYLEIVTRLINIKASLKYTNVLTENDILSQIYSPNILVLSLNEIYYIKRCS